MNEKELIIKIKKELQAEKAHFDKRDGLKKALEEKKEEANKIEQEIYALPSQRGLHSVSDTHIRELIDLWRGENGS